MKTKGDTNSFHSVLVNPDALPRFWIFMYRATPITYFLAAIVSTGIAGANVVCAANEIVKFAPPSGLTCGAYLQPYMISVRNTLLNANATTQCEVCPVARTDDLLAQLGIHYDDRWRNFGITLAYSVFNIAGAMVLYWLVRVPKGPRRQFI